MRYYRFEGCECRLTKDQTIRDRANTSRRVCKKHLNNISQIEHECLVCGELVILPPDKAMTSMCPDCSQAARVKRNREKWAAVPKDTTNIPKMPKRERCKWKGCDAMKAAWNKGKFCWRHALEPDWDGGRQSFSDHSWRMEYAGSSGVTVFAVDAEGGED